MKGPEMEFSSDFEIQKIPGLINELFEHVLHDEHTLFISDEATIWDVSMAIPEDLLNRLSQHYGKPLSMDDLKQPLWKLLRQLDEGRSASGLR
jgi:hypothetical protein